MGDKTKICLFWVFWGRLLSSPFLPISNPVRTVQLHSSVTSLQQFHADMEVSQCLPGPVQGVISASVAPDVIHPHITLTENSVPRQVSPRVHIAEPEEVDRRCDPKLPGRSRTYASVGHGRVLGCLTPLLFTFLMDSFQTKRLSLWLWRFRKPFCLLTRAPRHIYWSSAEMKLGLEDTPEAFLLNHVLSVYSAYISKKGCFWILAVMYM